MGKCLVRLRHLMDIIALANRIPLTLVRIHDFSRQRVTHRCALPSVRKINQPPPAPPAQADDPLALPMEPGMSPRLLAGLSPPTVASHYPRPAAKSQVDL